MSLEDSIQGKLVELCQSMLTWQGFLPLRGHGFCLVLVALNSDLFLSYTLEFVQNWIYTYIYTHDVETNNMPRL